MSNPQRFTFSFNGKNSLNDYGFFGNTYDFLLPQKRARKQQIPFRSGMYDYGAKYYDERILTMRCTWIKNITRAELREISYWLSRKGQIVVDAEPDKYYIGELYDSTELTAYYADIDDELITTDGTFELNFICEPFAYRTADIYAISTGTNGIKYAGTIETPCVIVLKNTTETPISNIKAVATRRKI